MIDFFERVVGPYPWGPEKLGIAETPHLGMEHQTVNAYGNEFERDDYGFDWLLHHELSHEWFGNLVSASNYADLWIHEGFAASRVPDFRAANAFRPSPSARRHSAPLTGRKASPESFEFEVGVIVRMSLSSPEIRRHGITKVSSCPGRRRP